MFSLIRYTLFKNLNKYYRPRMINYNVDDFSILLNFGDDYVEVDKTICKYFQDSGFKLNDDKKVII